MSIFRTALRVAAAHPVYLTVYVVFLSLLGVLVIGDLGTGAAAAASGRRRNAWPPRRASGRCVGSGRRKPSAWPGRKPSAGRRLRSGRRLPGSSWPA